MSTYIRVGCVSPAKQSPANIAAATVFTWDVTASPLNPSYTPTQTSAVFRWRPLGASTWSSTVNITGSTKSATVAANTFSATGAIQWDVTVTDTSGTTSTASSYFYPLILQELTLSAGAGISNTSPDESLSWEQILCKQLVFLNDPHESRSLFRFGSPSSTYRYKKLVAGGLYSKLRYANSDPDEFVIGGAIDILDSTFTAGTVTWNSQPQVRERAADFAFYLSDVPSNSMVMLPQFAEGGGTYSKAAALLANAPAIMLNGPVAGLNQTKYILPSAPMTLRLWIRNETVTSKPVAVDKTSGYVNPHVSQKFSWTLEPNGDYACYGTWTQSSATFYWRNGTSGNWTSSTISSSTKSKTLSANTMNAGTVQWYVTVTDNQGTTASSDVYTINTQDSAHVATPITPSGTIENGDGAIRFIWSDYADTGTAPTGADLQYSTDGTTWTTFAQPRTAATQYDLTAGTLPAGTVYWRVRSINVDNSAGSWSDPLSFLCFASPDPPVVSADGKPLLSVTWQSGGQQAYEITVDGKKYGPYFGTTQTWQVPEYLSDGLHSITVRTENTYGLWSQPTTISVTVANVPGDLITLTGSFDVDAELSWTTYSDTDFLIYRDDVLIGRTSGKSFTDRTCIGSHSWKVLARLDGGYYTASNTVRGEIFIGCPLIAELSGGSWTKLKKSTNSDRSLSRNKSRTVSLQQFAGLEYPSAEIAPYRTESVSFDVAWTHNESVQAEAFADLIGKTVIFKTQHEDVLVGVLSAWQLTSTDFYRAYSATVTRIHWREYIDADS